MDGVIIDSEPLHQSTEKAVFQLLGISIPDDVQNSFIGCTDAFMWSRIAEMYRLSIDIPEIIETKKSLYLQYLKEKTIFPIAGVVDLLTRLFNNKFLIALATSAPHEQIDYILHAFKIRHFFNSITSGEDVSMGKPHPEIFLTAAKSVGIEPQSCIVIEDSQNGIIAAKNARMKCIAYKNPNSGNQDLSKADMTITSYEDISLDLLRNGLSTF